MNKIKLLIFVFLLGCNISFAEEVNFNKDELFDSFKHKVYQSSDDEDLIKRVKSASLVNDNHGVYFYDFGTTQIAYIENNGVTESANVFYYAPRGGMSNSDLILRASFLCSFNVSSLCDSDGISKLKSTTQVRKSKRIDSAIEGYKLRAVLMKDDYQGIRVYK